MVMNEQKNYWQSDLYKGFRQKIKSDSHETWKCVDTELQRQIRCFPYVELSDVPRLQQVGKKAVGRQRNLGLRGDMIEVFKLTSGIYDTSLPPIFKMNKDTITRGQDLLYLAIAILVYQYCAQYQYKNFVQYWYTTSVM